MDIEWQLQRWDRRDFQRWNVGSWRREPRQCKTHRRRGGEFQRHAGGARHCHRQRRCHGQRLHWPQVHDRDDGRHLDCLRKRQLRGRIRSSWSVPMRRWQDSKLAVGGTATLTNGARVQVTAQRHLCAVDAVHDPDCDRRPRRHHVRRHQQQSRFSHALAQLRRQQCIPDLLQSSAPGDRAVRRRIATAAQTADNGGGTGARSAAGCNARRLPIRLSSRFSTRLRTARGRPSMRCPAKSTAACTIRRPKKHSSPAARCSGACGRPPMPVRRVNWARSVLPGRNWLMHRDPPRRRRRLPIRSRAAPYAPSRDLTFWTQGCRRLGPEPMATAMPLR